MLVDRIRAVRARLPSARHRRSDLCVAAYCHAFDVKPGPPADDRAERRDDGR